MSRYHRWSSLEQINTRFRKEKLRKSKGSWLIIRVEIQWWGKTAVPCLQVELKKKNKCWPAVIGKQAETRRLNFHKFKHKRLPPTRVIISQGWCWTPISEDLKSLETTDLRWFKCSSDLLTTTSWKRLFSLIILNEFPVVSICFPSASLSSRLYSLHSRCVPLCG